MQVSSVMHPHQVVLKERAEHITRPWQNAENLGRREGDVQKEAELAAPSESAQFVAEVEQVEVLHPYKVV